MMTIVSAANSKYKQIILDSIEKTKKAGYSTSVYSIDNSLGFGQSFLTKDFLNDLAKSPRRSFNGFFGRIIYKPYIIEQALREKNDFIVWLDADAYIVKNIDEVKSNEYDVGFTLRRYSERALSPIPIWSGFINAGVCFFNNTEKTKEFISLWKRKLFDTDNFSDQEAINRILLNSCDFSYDCYNKIFEVDGIKIKIFKTDEYNFYYNEPVGENVKIIHLRNSNCKKD